MTATPTSDSYCRPVRRALRSPMNAYLLVGIGGALGAMGAGVAIGEAPGMAFMPNRKSAGIDINVNARTVFGSREEGMVLADQIAGVLHQRGYLG